MNDAAGTTEKRSDEGRWRDRPFIELAYSQGWTMLSTSLDAEVPLRDVQEAASHSDPRTTMRYDRARGSLDRHATYVVAAFIAGAAR